MSKGRWVAAGCLGVSVLGCCATGGLFAVASRAVGALQGASVACDGRAVPGAQAYVAGGAQRVVGFTRGESGGWTYAGTRVPHSFPDAEQAEEATVVLCFEPVQRAVVESCAYEGGVVVRRSGYSQRVRAVEARTGATLRELDVAGPAAETCPEMVSTGGGGGGVSVRVLGIPVATVGANEELPTERMQEGGEPSAREVEAAFQDLVR